MTEASESACSCDCSPGRMRTCPSSAQRVVGGAAPDATRAFRCVSSEDTVFNQVTLPPSRTREYTEYCPAGFPYRFSWSPLPSPPSRACSLLCPADFYFLTSGLALLRWHTSQSHPPSCPLDGGGVCQAEAQPRLSYKPFVSLSPLHHNPQKEGRFPCLDVLLSILLSLSPPLRAH